MRAGFVGRMGPPGKRRSQQFDADTLAIIAAMTTPPTTERQTLINNAVVALKSAGVWSKLDMLQVYAAHNQQAARVDWKVPSRIATAVNSPGFTTDRGFLPNGSTSYVDTNYQPASGPNFNINGHVLGFRTNSDMSAANVIDVGNLDNALGPLLVDNSVSVRSSSSSSVSVGSGVATSRLNLFIRDDANGGNAYYAGNDGVLTLIGPFSRTAATLDNTTTVYAGARNNGSISSASNRRNSMVFGGGKLSLPEATAFASIMQTYMTGVGNTA